MQTAYVVEKSLRSWREILYITVTLMLALISANLRFITHVNASIETRV